LHSIYFIIQKKFPALDFIDSIIVLKPWITGKESGIGAAVQASYDGEEITNQATIEIVNINGKEISASAASEAFDEPLTMAQVLAIVDPFIV